MRATAPALMISALVMTVGGCGSFGDSMRHPFQSASALPGAISPKARDKEEFRKKVEADSFPTAQQAGI